MSSSESHKISLLLLIVLVLVEVCQCAYVTRVSAQPGAASPDDLLLLSKKGFMCNDFGGCVGKRSGTRMQGVSLAELVRLRQALDLSGHQGGEELSRQILSDIRVREAIQEAGAEPYRGMGAGYPWAYSLQ